MAEIAYPLPGSGLVDLPSPVRELYDPAATEQALAPTGVINYKSAAISELLSRNRSSSRKGYVSPVELDPRWGLLDPTVFLEYTNGCKCNYLAEPRPTDSCVLEVHHGVFSRKRLKRNDVPLAIKQLRASRLNLFVMLKCQEDLYHERQEDDIRVKEINRESAGYFLEEDKWIQEYTSLTWGLAIAQETLDNDAPEVTNGQQARIEALANVLQGLKYGALYKVKAIEVVHPRVVTGALQRYAELTREGTIVDVVRDRLSEDPVTIQTKPHVEAHLATVADTIINKTMPKLDLPTRRLLENGGGFVAPWNVDGRKRPKKLGAGLIFASEGL